MEGSLENEAPVSKYPTTGHVVSNDATNIYFALQCQVEWLVVLHSSIDAGCQSTEDFEDHFIHSINQFFHVVHRDVAFDLSDVRAVHAGKICQKLLWSSLAWSSQLC
jgi:hypothetical protein